MQTPFKSHPADRWIDIDGDGYSVSYSNDDSTVSLRQFGWHIWAARSFVRDCGWLS